MADTTVTGDENRSDASGSTQSSLNFLKRHMREYGILFAFIAIFTFFAIATGGNLLKSLSITNLINQQSFIIVMAVGMLMVIVAGHIDLSVGSVLGFIGALCAVLSTSGGMDYRLVIVICLIVGALIGAVQGAFIAYLKIPSFIVTLAGMLVFKGLILATLDGQQISIPSEIRNITTTFVPDVFGDFGLNFFGKNGLDILQLQRFNTLCLLVGVIFAALIALSAVYTRKQQIKRGVADEPFAFFVAKISLICFVIVGFSFLLAGWKGLPNVLLIMAVVVAFFHFVTQHTTLGRRVYAIGGNEKAAKLSGVNTERLTMVVFATMGFLAAVGGIIYAARLSVAQPKAGDTLELDIIAAVFIGGASMSGGVGTVIGAIIGALIMGVLNQGMTMLSIEVQWQLVIKGSLLLAAVVFDVLNKRKAT